MRIVRDFPPILGRYPLRTLRPRTGSVNGMRLIDVRAGRFEQAIVVVTVLAGFVFQQAFAIPVAAVIAVLGAGMAGRSPIRRFWTNAIGPRRHAAGQLEPESVVRLQSLIIAAGLTLATLTIVAGSVGIASIIAAVIALIAALGATGFITLAAELDRRRGR